MENILLTINVILAFILVILVLIQKSEGGALGIGVSQDSFMFSRSAGDFFTKATAVVATLFILCSLSLTIISVGLLVIIYTVLGGSKAVSYTQKQQMGIILIGMIMVFYYLTINLSQYVSLNETLMIAGMFEKTNAISFSFDPSERYTIWTGLLGGFFLPLSYFGTDQSQVLRYINAKNMNESRMGL